MIYPNKQVKEISEYFVKNYPEFIQNVSKYYSGSCNHNGMVKILSWFYNIWRNDDYLYTQFSQIYIYQFKDFIYTFSKYFGVFPTN